MTHTKRPFKLLPNIPHVILCEGRDEEMFLRYYIEYLVNKKLVPLEKVSSLSFPGSKTNPKRIPS